MKKQAVISDDDLQNDNGIIAKLVWRRTILISYMNHNKCLNEHLDDSK